MLVAAMTFTTVFFMTMVFMSMLLGAMLRLRTMLLRTTMLFRPMILRCLTHWATVAAAGSTLRAVITTMLRLPLSVLRMAGIGIITFIMAVPNRVRVVTPAVSGIPCSVLGFMHPRCTLVQHHLVCIIKIKISIAWWQVRACNPCTAIHIYILLCVHIIVSIYIGNIVVVHMIITGRSPGWLCTYVYLQTDLCMRCLAKKTGSYYREKNDFLFHTRYDTITRPMQMPRLNVHG